MIVCSTWEIEKINKCIYASIGLKGLSGLELEQNKFESSMKSRETRVLLSCKLIKSELSIFESFFISTLLQILFFSHLYKATIILIYYFIII